MTPAPPFQASGDTSLASGLVAYWKLDDASGTSVADGVGSNTGTWNGTLGNQWTTGKINSAGNFNGTDNYVNVGTNANLNPVAITMTAWVKAGALSNTYNSVVARIFSGGATSTNALEVRSDGKLQLYAEGVSGTVSYDGTGSQAVATGAWYFLAFTYDATSGLRGYVNGSLDKAVTGKGVLNQTAGVATAIGTDLNSSGRNFTGAIDEVGIWNRALSASEVSTLYNAGNGDPFGNSSCGFSY